MSALGLHPDYEGQRYLMPERKALIIKDGRMSVDVASVRGSRIPIDPNSFRWFIRSEYDDRFHSDPILQHKVDNSLPIDEIDFTQYDIVFLAGGVGSRL